MFFNKPLQLYQYQKVRQYPQINERFQEYIKDDTILTTLNYQYQIPLEGFIKLIELGQIYIDERTKHNIVIDLIRIINQQKSHLDMYKQIIIVIQQQIIFVEYIYIQQYSYIHQIDYSDEIQSILNRLKINIISHSKLNLNEINHILLQQLSRIQDNFINIYIKPCDALFLDMIDIFDCLISRQIITLINYQILLYQDNMSKLFIEQIYEIFISHIDILVNYFQKEFNQSIQIFSDILMMQEYLNSYKQISTLQNILLEKFQLIEQWLALENIRLNIEKQLKPILNLQFDKILQNEKIKIQFFIKGQHENLLKQPLDQFLKELMNQCSDSITEEVEQQIRQKLNDLQ